MLLTRLLTYSFKQDLNLSVKVYSTRAINYFGIYKKDTSKIPSAGFANSVDNTFKGKVFRFIRGNFFIPDPRKGWNKYAFKQACVLIEKEGIKNIITTSPPHSTQLIGLKIKEKYPSVNWIADLRDPWTDIYYYKQFYPGFISKWIDLKYEKNVLKKADKIITVGASLKNLFSLKVKGIENKTEVITNGYDADDFAGIPSTSPSMFTVTYVGTLSDVYPVEGFLNALNSFKEKGNEFVFRFIGAVSENQKELIRSKIANSESEFISYVNHATAIEYMMKTSVLLLIIPDHSSNKSILTGKLFEYIASGKPIICLGPEDGDAAEIIRNTGNGRTFSYSDSEEISKYILSIVSEISVTDVKSAKAFSRLELTRKIIPLLSN